MSICTECGKMESLREGVVIDDRFYCTECTETCTECRERKLKNDMREIDGAWVCDDCLNYNSGNGNYFVCEKCGEWYHIDDERIVHARYDEEVWCSDCADDYAFYCSQCGEWYSNDYYTVYETTDGESICNECLNNDEWVLCYDCGNATRDWEEGNDGNYYCENCFEEHKADKPIHDYGWTPDDDGCGYNFYKNNEEEEPRYYIGFELEVSGDESKAPAYLEHFTNGEDIIFLTHDSSIENGGFEITSHPMTFDYLYKSSFTNEFENSLKYLDMCGFKSHNKGGLHVHVSNDNISSTQLGVMACILYNAENSNEYKKILAITQRKAEKINRWASVSVPSWMAKDEFFNRIVYNNRITYERYTGLNVTSHTVEFRIFNGNLRLERFLKNIEFVQAVLDYSEIIAKEIKAINDDNFPLDSYLNKYADINALLKYVNETAEKYQNLKAFLIEKGIKADESMADAVLSDTQNNA